MARFVRPKDRPQHGSVRRDRHLASYTWNMATRIGMEHSWGMCLRVTAITLIITTIMLCGWALFLLLRVLDKASTVLFTTAVTQWIANGLTGNTTDFKYLTAYVGGQLTYSGGTITPVQGTEDAIEFQRYYGINIATVSTTGCTTNNASCPLYGPTEAETWSDFSDTSSTSGYQQSMAAIQAINFCGAAHTATCKAATYEGGMSPDGASTSTSGPFTQAVSDSFTPAGWHLSTDAVGYQLASQNSFAFTNEYQALQYYIGQGGVNTIIKNLG